ncbi:MAG: GNAT family N-acetyltransferase [Promethearchaeota archaeon]|nr:MAG: GNAT family N-acetyltransferase [Candidatus Lokiarchaeota archaeon]
MITVRKFRDEDALEASNLIRKTLYEVNSKFYPTSVINYMCNEFSPRFLIDLSKEREFFVAIENSKIIGTITIIYDYIGTVFVNPEQHFKGIGTKLMESIENLAKERKIKKLRLESSINAVNFYEKLGYKKGEISQSEEYGITYEMSKVL